MQGRKVAEHVVDDPTVTHRNPSYESAPSAILTDPKIADVSLGPGRTSAQPAP
jgi:hypothetical protein